MFPKSSLLPILLSLAHASPLDYAAPEISPRQSCPGIHVFGAVKPPLAQAMVAQLQLLMKSYPRIQAPLLKLSTTLHAVVRPHVALLVMHSQSLRVLLLWPVK
jgi:hypothetical protein